MKVLFRQCRVCPNDKSCEFRDSVKEELGDLFKGMTALISCPEYRGLFKKGDRVRFEVHDMDDTEDLGVEGGYRGPCAPYYESTGIKVKGTITGVIRRNKLFQVLLDKKIKLQRIGAGERLEEVELEFYTKPANQLEKMK